MPHLPLATHHSFLLALARRRLAPELRAKASPSDLAQDACLLAHRNLDQFRGSTDAEFRAWLAQILDSVLRDYRRRFLDAAKRSLAAEVPLDHGSRARLLSLLADGSPSPSSDAARRESAAALRDAIAKLPEDERQVLLCRVVEDLSFADVARRLGLSERTAHRTFGRAICKLQLQLRDPR